MSRTTLNKIEQGDGGVSLGNYATVLFTLGLLDPLSDLADPRNDAVGLELEEERLSLNASGWRSRKPPSKSKGSR